MEYKDVYIIVPFAYYLLKFMFSKKATKIDEIFTVNLTLCRFHQSFVAFFENTNFKKFENSIFDHNVKSTLNILSIFVAFLEYTNFKIFSIFQVRCS